MIGGRGKLWIVPLLIVLIVSLSGCPEPVVHYTGTGTAGDPYVVYTADGLETVRGLVMGEGGSEQLDAVIHLGANINLNDLDAVNDNWTPMGTSTSRFAGTFDGKGYVIINMRIDLSGTATDGAGFFGYISDAAISDLGLISVDVTGINCVGGLAGFAASSTISSCYVTGSVAGSGNFTGGLVGDFWTSGSIGSCYVRADVSGALGVGGFTGRINGTNINHIVIDSCYTTGNISGTNAVGGLSGYGYWSDIKNCVAANSAITRTSGSDISFHRMLGYTSSATLSNNYANSAMTLPTGVSLYASGTQVDGADATLLQLQSSAFYSTTAVWNGASWNNASVWTLNDGAYPGLVW